MKSAPSSTIEYVDAQGKRRAGSGVFVLPSAAAFDPDRIQSNITQHARMISHTAPDVTARPLVYAIISPFVAPSPGMTNNGRPVIIDAQYDAIEEQLNSLADLDAEGHSAIEAGAVATAKDVIQYVKNERLTPPMISRLDEEAVLMLWAVGELRYAVTVTEGEIGYVVRRPGETLRRKSGLEVAEFNLYMLE